MRVLLLVLLAGIAGCGGDNSPDDVAVLSFLAVGAVTAEPAGAAAPPPHPSLPQCAQPPAAEPGLAAGRRGGRRCGGLGACKKPIESFPFFP